MIDFRFQNRREFLKYTASCGLMLYGLNADAHNEFLANKDLTELHILYTNDQHSRIENHSHQTMQNTQMKEVLQNALH